MKIAVSILIFLLNSTMDFIALGWFESCDYFAILKNSDSFKSKSTDLNLNINVIIQSYPLLGGHLLLCLCLAGRNLWLVALFMDGRDRRPWWPILITRQLYPAQPKKKRINCMTCRRRPFHFSVFSDLELYNSTTTLSILIAKCWNSLFFYTCIKKKCFIK